MIDRARKVFKTPMICTRYDLEAEIWYSNQDGVRKLFVERLIRQGRHFDLIDGNIMSIIHSGVPCLVAHMDTVNDKAMVNPLQYNVKTHVLSRKDSILGADDKAGVQIIWDNFDDCNFILTRDEETGARGAASIASNSLTRERLEDYEVPCFLEFDRMDNHHIIGPHNGYCEHELADLITAISGGDYTVNVGVFTDLDELNLTGVEGVNLSVGYYNQHSKNETLNMTEFTRARQLAKELLVGLNGLLFRFEGEAQSTSYLEDDDDFLDYTEYMTSKPTECDMCGDPITKWDNRFVFEGSLLCEVCVDEYQQISGEDDA